jgi:hypothetical protein
VGGCLLVGGGVEEWKTEWWLVVVVVELGVGRAGGPRRVPSRRFLRVVEAVEGRRRWWWWKREVCLVMLGWALEVLVRYLQQEKVLPWKEGWLRSRPIRRRRRFVGC